MKSGSAGSAYRLAVLDSHPIQYFAPMYRRLDAEPSIDLTVYFQSRAGVDTYRDEGFGQEIRWDVPLLEGYEARFLPNLRGARRRGGFWRQVNPGIVSELRAGSYDAIWLHGHDSLTNLLAVAGARTTGTALFMRCDTHLGLDRPAWKRVLRGPAMTGFYRLFDACLAIGSRNADFYRAHGVDEERIFLVPYTVDNRRFRTGATLDDAEKAAVRKALALPDPSVPVVLFVSKLSTGKHPFDLLEAFRIAKERVRTNGALAFVGDGAERARLEESVQDRDDVHLLGFRNQSELPQIYGACEAFVLPSENEAWGLVLNEAMASGLPVIASDQVGAAADLVEEGGNGFVFPCGDIEALAERLERLLGDARRRQKMGCVSKRIIAEWDFDRCVAGVHDALEHATGGRS